MKNINIKRAVILGLSLGSFFLVLNLWICKAEAQPSEESLRRKNRAAAVVVEVVYLNPIQKIEEGKLAFGVTLNTHSVDLDQYAIEKISILRDDKGKEIKASAWDGPAGGGHHRSGMLFFSDKDTAGKPFIKPETKFIEVVIKGIAGENERVFHWDLPVK